MRKWPILHVGSEREIPSHAAVRRKRVSPPSATTIASRATAITTFGIGDDEGTRQFAEGPVEHDARGAPPPAAQPNTEGE